MTQLYAAAVYDAVGEGDELLQRFVGQLQKQGWCVRGLVTSRGKDPAGRLPMQIADVHTGKTFDISQRLGSGSQSCSLDPGALVTASGVLRQALNEVPDLVVVNRFGTAEASGWGFAAEMLALMSAEIPLLTLVSRDYLDDWLYFTGDPQSTLPLSETALQAWAEQLPRLAGLMTS